MKREAVEKIEGLVREDGFIYSLGWILLRNLFLDAEQVLSIDWRSRLSHQELSFLIGLMAKQPIRMHSADQDIVQSHYKKADQYFRELHDAFVKPTTESLVKKAEERIHASSSKRSDEHKEYQAIFGTGDAMAECIFYGDSGAYDFQYLELASKRYARDKEWLLSNKGFQLETAINLCKKLKELQIARFSALIQPGSLDEFSRMALPVFCFSEEDLKEFDRQEVKNILDTFTVKPGKVNHKLALPGEYNIINSHPILLLDNRSYFAPILFNLAQSIYESPFYWMLNNPTYKDVSLRNRGNMTVEIAYEMLANVFGSSNVYKEVKIHKSKAIVLTDIDLLAVTGNKAIVCQIKSKKLTALSRAGNEEKLRRDFAEAIQESYEQAKLCRQAILEKGSRLIAANGHEVTLDDSIDDVYLLCITSDHYPAITFQARTYLQKALEDPSPIAINIFDLDVLTYYLKDPFEFLYYLRQRIRLDGTFIAPSEIVLLAYHLNQKLYPVRDEKTGKLFNQVLIDDMGHLIDAHFPCARGYHPKTKAMEKLYAKWSNPEFQEIILQLKKTKQPGFTDAIFFLYDMAGKGGDDLIQAIKMLKNRCLKEKKSLRFYMIGSEDKSGISYVCNYENGLKLNRHVIEYSQIKKYQTKADLWLGLGGQANSMEDVAVVAFNKTPWRHDSVLESISKTRYVTNRVRSLITGKSLGRNDLCYCGSAIKYKKCHGK